MKKMENDLGSTINTLGDTIGKATPVILVYTHTQRRAQSDLLVELTKHLRNAFVNTQNVDAETQAAKVAVVELAKSDYSSGINKALEELCDSSHLCYYQTAQQVISEVVESAETMQDVVDAIRERVDVFCIQRHLVMAVEGVGIGEKYCRIASLLDDIAAQLNAAFNFETMIVPHGNNVPDNETLSVDETLVNNLLRWLSIQD